MSDATEIKDDILALIKNPIDSAALADLQEESRELHGSPNDPSKRTDDVLRRVAAQKELDALTEHGIIPRVEINSDGCITCAFPTSDDPNSNDVTLIRATPNRASHQILQFGSK